jgi:diguanylate cyclase (GGDEF)-like protein/PAS domain S-box-containing protein
VTTPLIHVAHRISTPSVRRALPSLRLAVGGLGVAVVVLMALVVSEVVAGHLRQTATQAAVHNVETIVRGYVDPQIKDGDLDLGAPLNEGISAALKRIALSGDIRQVSIWSRDGRIVYSTNPELLGRRYSVGELLSSAFTGVSVSAYHPAGEGSGTVPADLVARQHLEILVPIRGPTDGNPIGVYKVYQDARPIESQVSATRQDVFFIALLAASLLLLALVAAFGGASARMARQNRLLRERAARERLLTTDLRRSEERFRSLVRNSADVILICDAEGTITYESPAVEQVLGYDPAARVASAGFDIVHPADFDWAQAMFADLVGKAGAEAEAEFRARHADGTYRWLQARIKNLLDDAAVGGIVVNYRDVTERRSLEDQLRYQAFHDTLTGLPNRALFMDRLDHALTRGRRDHSALGVLFLDLDDFKSVNDSLGHGAGDELLVGVAARLRRVLRESDTAARMGGDEFAVLLEDVGVDHSLAEVGERVLAALRETFIVQGQKVRISASAGAAVPGRGEQTAEEMLRHADVAMYAAKNQGKDRLVAFRPEIHLATIDRHQLRSEIHTALERDQFTLVYQPLIELAGGAIVGAEALLRWRHPTRGLLAPDSFVSLAEESGVIVPLGRWVLQEACRQAVAWRAGDSRRLQMNVNLSSRQIEDPGLVGDVAAALEAAGLDAGLLTLEITESVLLRDVETVLARLTELKQLGVQLAIDDFGTGYSSLSYLRRFPVDVLKIDRSFIASVDTGAAEGALVRSIVSIAQILGLETVAEGIEGTGQLEMLRGLGVNEGQGYIFARPVEPNAFARLLSGRAKLATRRSVRTPRTRQARVAPAVPAGPS